MGGKTTKQELSLIEYDYDWRGQLSETRDYSQIDAEGNGCKDALTRTLYLYDAAGHLIKKSIPDGKGLSTTHYFYDDLGRLIHSQDNQGHHQWFEYDDAHQRVIETNARGLRTIKLYDRSGLLLSEQRLSTEHDYGMTTYSYDKGGRLVTQTKPGGSTEFFFYDTQGRLHAQVNAHGQITEYSYTTEGLLRQTRACAQSVSTQGWLTAMPLAAALVPSANPQDRISQIIYDEYQQEIYHIAADGAVIAYNYNGQGQLINKTAYAQRLIPWPPATLLTRNDIHLTVTAEDREHSYYYDELGRLAAEVDEGGFATSYQYNRLGSVFATRRYATAVTQRSGQWQVDQPQVTAQDIILYSLYDASNRLVGSIDGSGYLTEYQYNEQGTTRAVFAYANKIQKAMAIDEFTSIASLRPSAARNDHRTEYQYNDLGLLIEESTQSGLITSYSYDADGLLSQKDALINAEKYNEKNIIVTMIWAALLLASLQQV